MAAVVTEQPGGDSADTGKKLTLVVTGANIGCGYEACRQLAATTEVGHIVVGVRSAEKAKKTIDSLVADTQKDSSFFSSILIDNGDLASIKAAVEVFPKFDRLCLNAGGLAKLGIHKPSGATNTMVINTLGAAALVDGLLAANKIQAGARVIYIGSEVSRNIWSLTGLLPFYLCNGFGEEDVDRVIGNNYQACYGCNCLPVRAQLGDYKNSKIIGQLHFAHLAKENPEIYFASTSPGAVGGSFFQKSKFPMKQLVNCIPCAFRCARISHACSPKKSLQIGSKRYVDMLTGPTRFPPGAMSMSGPDCCCCLSWGAYGPLVDNRPLVGYLRDENLAAQTTAKVRAWEDKWAQQAFVNMEMKR